MASLSPAHADALRVLLWDMKRNGLQDVVSEDPRIFWGEQPPVPVVSPVPQEPHARQAASLRPSPQPQKEAPQEAPFEAAAHLWRVGQEHPIQVLCCAEDALKGQHPLAKPEQQLMQNIWKAAGWAWEDTGFIGLIRQDYTGPQCAALSKALEAMVSTSSNTLPRQLVVCGPAATQALWGDATLSFETHRADAGNIHGTSPFVMHHPRLLLARPIMKRLTWQGLLKFTTFKEAASHT